MLEAVVLEACGEKSSMRTGEHSHGQTGEEIGSRLLSERTGALDREEMHRGVTR